MKRIITLLSLLLVLMMAICLSACQLTPPASGDGGEENEGIKAVYATYVEYTKDKGETPLDYEDWLATIKGADGLNGKDGKDGVDGKDGKDGVDGITPEFKLDGGELLVSYDKGASWTSLGTVAGADGLTPSIGENGNWWIGDEDTNVPADGEGTSNVRCTVTFVSDGGLTLPSLTLNKYDRIPRPEDPVRGGYEFLGWYVDGEPWSFSFGLVTGDITLTAKWKPAVSNVKLLGNGGELMYDTLTLAFGSYYELETPARDGFKFLGWFDMYGNPVDSIGFWTYTDDVILQASWQSESSGGGNTDNNDGVYWRETELIFEMNKHSQYGELSSGVERYYAGGAGEGELVDDLVAERNKAAATAANVRVMYSYLPDRVSEYAWGQNVNYIYIDTATYGPGSVDMYCNFAYDMTCASIKGCFANLRSTDYGRGNNFFRFNDADYDPVGENYFDSNAAEGYFYDYMKSLTLSDDKMYCLGSNYTTDLVRAFLVIPVNITLMNQIERDSLPTPTYYDYSSGTLRPTYIRDDQTNIQYFYDIVWNNAWTYDVLAQYCNAVYLDINSNNPASGSSNLGDKLGFALGGSSSLPATGMLYSSSVNIIEKTPIEGEPGKYNITYPKTNPQLSEFALALNNLVYENSSAGIAVVTSADTQAAGAKTDLLAIRDAFVSDNMLFGGIVALGSLEDESSYQTMRASGKSGFGIAPIPMYRSHSSTVQDEYKIHIHNLARIVAIAAQTDKFEMCSAFLDYQSRNSEAVLNTYYERNLAASVRGDVTEDNIKMLTYIRNHVGDCFDKTFEDIIGNYNDSTDPFAAMRRWHEIIRSHSFQVTGMDIVYDELYMQKTYDIQQVINQWNELP